MGCNRLAQTMLGLWLFVCWAILIFGLIQFVRGAAA